VKGGKLAKVEGYLWDPRRSVGLAFEVIRPSTNDGVFHVRVMAEDGYIDCLACADWVWENFDKVYVESAIQYGLASSKDTGGRLLFVDVEELDVLFQADMAQTSKLKFYPPKGAEKEGYFLGMIRTDGAEAATFKRYSGVEAEAVFTKDYLEYVRLKQRKGKVAFLPVPVGRPRDQVANQSGIDPGAPYLRWMQGAEDTCLLGSVCSALFYLGFGLKAGGMMDQKEDYLKSNNRWEWVLQQLNKTLGFLQTKRFKKGRLNVLEYNDAHPLVLGLCASDGSVDHAVTISDGWIFNAPYQRAVKLTAENLDGCCSTNFSKSKFVTYDKAYVLEDFPGKKRVMAKGWRCFNDNSEKPFKKRKWEEIQK
jgi:hypothetical protein